MEVFDDARQIVLEAETEDYFSYTLDRDDGDLVKRALALPIPVPICKLAYTLPGGGGTNLVNVYPTLQVHTVQAHWFPGLFFFKMFGYAKFQLPFFTCTICDIELFLRS